MTAALGGIPDQSSCHGPGRFRHRRVTERPGTEEEAEWQGFDLCTVSRIITKYNRKSGETWADYE